MITCTSTRFDRPDDGEDGRECGEPATQRVTIRGADRAIGLRPNSTPTPWNLEREPRCDRCARVDQGIASRLFSGASFDADTITAQ